MAQPFIIYLKNKISSEFEQKKDVSAVVRTEKGYQITFNNGKSYHYSAERVKYYPLTTTHENVQIKENSRAQIGYNAVDNAPSQNRSIIEYFKNILIQSGGVSFDIQSEESEETEEKDPNRISSEILLKTLDKIDLSETRSALSNYLHGLNPAIMPPKKAFIYPFGCNESQKQAVETSLTNSISIIEGPPGTGKTQTILNIIANLIVQNKSVAIVSNNNSAVFNIFEKLQKYGYERVAASLGNNKNKQAFFNDCKAGKIDESLRFSTDELTEAINTVKDLEGIITQCFQYRNKLATLKTQLSDAETEFNHIKTEQPVSPHIKRELDKKFHRKWNQTKLLKLKDLLSQIDIQKKLSITNKLRFMLQYGFFDLSSIRTYCEELDSFVNHKFYELYIDKIKEDISLAEKWLESNNEKDNLDKLIGISKNIFNGILYNKYQKIEEVEFTAANYLNRFGEFIKQYPVLLSSTLSLHTSIPKGYLFDYLIIDESSQVDIIKSAVCFSCCRNVIVVGDSMQLTHIINQQTKGVADQLLTTHQVPDAYDYVKHNILSSLKCLYGDNIKSTLLKEHYRCHPTIIGFCNKKYYNNSLVIMTSGENHPFKIIETSISGGRGSLNQRQIDETELYIRTNYSADYTRVGVIAPYRTHADSLQKQLPADTEADTIHKFQGREKDTIIFNTVRNQINEFIDNPNLINVAVSRAAKEFVIVKPESMELPHGTNIGDMIRYICYTADPEKTIVKGKIRSVFDLLYKEYNKSLTTFLASNRTIKGSAAEVIIHQLLTDKILPSNPIFSTIDMAREYKLRDLIKEYDGFTEEEVSFIKNNSRLDFLLYNKIDKSPILAIEVDGISFHENELQQKRDNKKNHILNLIDLPLLRLSTNGHNEEHRILESLYDAMRLN